MAGSFSLMGTWGECACVVFVKLTYFINWLASLVTRDGVEDIEASHLIHNHTQIFIYGEYMQNYEANTLRQNFLTTPSSIARRERGSTHALIPWATNSRAIELSELISGRTINSKVV